MSTGPMAARANRSERGFFMVIIGLDYEGTGRPAI
jgi:hypothetical protein